MRAATEAAFIAAASPPRALAATVEPPPMPPPTLPLEPLPPPLPPPPPPEAAAQLPADVLEGVGWLAPQKRRLDVRIHRSRQPTRGRSPRSGPISRSDAMRLMDLAEGSPPTPASEYRWRTSEEWASLDPPDHNSSR